MVQLRSIKIATFARSKLHMKQVQQMAILSWSLVCIDGYRKIQQKFSTTMTILSGLLYIHSTNGDDIKQELRNRQICIQKECAPSDG
jgi:hypothetical protein